MAQRDKSNLLTKKRPKIQCEVCAEGNEKVLQRHHIVHRTDLNTNNNDYNLAVICANCHNKIHAGELEIIGVFPGTRPPTGRILVYKLNGVCNVPGLENEVYYTPRPTSMTYFIPEENEQKKENN